MALLDKMCRFLVCAYLYNADHVLCSKSKDEGQLHEYFAANVSCWQKSVHAWAPIRS